MFNSKCTLFRRALRVLLLSLGLFGATALADCYGTTNFWGSSNLPIRLDGNHVKTYGQSWVTDDNAQYWAGHITSYALLNGNRISGGFTFDGSPGYLVASDLSTPLQPFGPGTYADQSYHWFTSSVMLESIASLYRVDSRRLAEHRADHSEADATRLRTRFHARSFLFGT